MGSYILMWKNYAVFSGRTRRKDYWMATLFNVIAIILLYIIAGVLIAATNSIAFLALVYIYSLATLVPGIALTVRRLHDIGKSGLFILLGLIPGVGGIILLVFACMDSQPAANEYGENPKAVVMA